MAEIDDVMSAVKELRNEVEKKSADQEKLTNCSLLLMLLKRKIRNWLKSRLNWKMHSVKLLLSRKKLKIGESIW